MEKSKEPEKPEKPKTKIMTILNILEKALITAAKKADELSDNSNEYQNEGYSGDISTIADLELEKAIIDTFRESGISAIIMSEEAGKLEINTAATQSKYKKYIITIDPLDGSNNYCHARGILPHCTTIAIFDNTKDPRFRNVLCAGTIEHTTKNIWLAERKKGTTFNNRQTAISKKTSIDQKGKYIVDMFYHRNWEIFKTLNKDKTKINIIDIGASAMDYALISSGHVDAVMSSAQKALELGPGYLLAKEAGITITDLKGNPLDDAIYDFDGKYGIIFACTKELHTEILRTISAHTTQ